VCFTASTIQFYFIPKTNKPVNGHKGLHFNYVIYNKKSWFSLLNRLFFSKSSQKPSDLIPLSIYLAEEPGKSWLFLIYYVIKVQAFMAVYRFIRFWYKVELYGGGSKTHPLHFLIRVLLRRLFTFFTGIP
jgi:hypothetical protein